MCTPRIHHSGESREERTRDLGLPVHLVDLSWRQKRLCLVFESAPRRADVLRRKKADQYVTAGDVVAKNRPELIIRIDLILGYRGSVIEYVDSSCSPPIKKNVAVCIRGRLERSHLLIPSRITQKYIDFHAGHRISAQSVSPSANVIGGERQDRMIVRYLSARPPVLCASYPFLSIPS